MLIANPNRWRLLKQPDKQKLSKLDDSRVKTMGEGKSDQTTDGKIQILVYRVGSTVPPSQNQSH